LAIQEQRSADTGKGLRGIPGKAAGISLADLSRRTLPATERDLRRVIASLILTAQVVPITEVIADRRTPVLLRPGILLRRSHTIARRLSLTTAPPHRVEAAVVRFMAVEAHRTVEADSTHPVAVVGMDAR